MYPCTLYDVSGVDAAGCTPLVSARVDVWHCDALGVYSDVQDPRFKMVGRKFLRGYQVTDSAGRVEFLTVYPGWYEVGTGAVQWERTGRAESGSGYRVR